MDPTFFLIYLFTFILSELLRPKPKVEQQKPAGLGDFSFPTATEGRVVPLLWGTVKIDGPNVVWYGDLEQVPITVKQKTSLFSSTNIVTGFKYKVGLQFAMCRGVVDELTKVWIGDDLVFSGSVVDGGNFTINKPDLFGGNTLGNGGVVGTLEFFAGSETQNPSGYLSSRSINSVSINSGGTGYTDGDTLTVVGGTFATAATIQVLAAPSGIIASAKILNQGSYSITPTTPVSVTGGTGTGATFNVTFHAAAQQHAGQTPAYRGTCYLAPLADPIYVGNSTSIKPWSFELRRTTIPGGPATGGDNTVNSGHDSNLVNVLYEILTNSDWGLGILAADIDTVNFASAGSTLRNEGNGFSFLLDNPLDAIDLIKQLEEQMQGIVFVNKLTGKWQINLARGGYDISTLTEINAANSDVEEFTRGSWEGTTNQVRTQFNDRADSYKETFGLAQDMANIRIQDGVNISVTKSYPGVKNETLANQIAWRDLRSLSYPLAKGKVVVDRSFYDAQPGKLYKFTDADLNISQMPIRVLNVDFGKLDDNKIVIDFVQDIFLFQVGAFSDPTNSGWTPPSDTLEPFSVDEQLAFEAPRAFVVRDPLGVGITDKIWYGARRHGPEAAYQAVERHSAGTPSGAFTLAGEAFSFLLLGKLHASLGAGTAYPTTSLLLDSTPDTQAALEGAFTDGANLTDIGTNLINLILVGNEFMLASSAQASGGNVQLNGVYRSVLDSVQAAHTVGTNVYLIFVGGGMTDSTFTPLDNVDVKLLPHSSSALLSDTLATAIALQMQNRVRRPYPPSSLSLNGVFFASSGSINSVGGGPETFALAVGLNRRDYRATNEISELTADAATLFTDYPTLNSTTHEIDVYNDPAGTNTFLFTASGSSATINVLRILILRFNAGNLPTTLGLTIRAKHTYESVVYSSLQQLVWPFTVSSGLSGQFAFGALLASAISHLYTATTNGTYNFTLSSAFTLGNVEYRKNGGAWLPLVTAGTTTGSIAGIVATDTIEVRHLSTDVAALKELDMAAPGGGQNAFAILYT